MALKQRPPAERSMAMARGKPNAWGCEHPLPIELVPTEEGRRARCLRCGQCGPVRPDVEGAMRALRGEVGRREKLGA